MVRLPSAIELSECKKFCPKRAKFHPNLKQVFDSFGCLWDYTVFSIIFAPDSSKLKRYNTAYCLLRSLVKHSCINPRSPTFSYLDEKLIDTGLMKFLDLCPSALSRPFDPNFVSNEEPIERHDSSLISTRVHVLDLCPRKAPCLRSMFHLLRRLPSCGLDTSLSSTQVALLLD
ncbi:hypothetical protein B296_00006577 [Ensete ventricosum]|uniref:Uncharacterized protein n=1 Tax=Ensete ventricosum TaxID=4639 RepID=A0A426ZQS3_ENSVE|nr:hypothetical protein B296_00006577 [Ensete ventricosum]